MRKIRRRALTAKTLEFLQKRTDTVRVAADPQAEAKRLWQQKDNAAFDEIREILQAMASGLHRCMYCEDSAGTDIEHFHPKSAYPELAFTWTNYLWACSHCNSNEKRDQFPLESGQPLLIDPTDPGDDPLQHLRLSPSTGKLSDRTKKGKESIKVFGLNRERIERGRRNRWSALVGALIPRYAQARRAGNDERAAELRDVICEEPFSSVLSHILQIAGAQGAPAVIPPECRAALADCPEIADWLA